MKFVTYNIQYGIGKDHRYDLARIAREVETADLIALQEVERHWQRSGCVDAPAVLGSHLPEHHWVYGPNLDMDASYREPAGRLVNRRRQFGTMILSRAPIVSSRNHLLPKYGTLTQHSIQQGALEAVIMTERAGPVRVYSVHLSHLSIATRMPQIDALRHSSGDTQMAEMHRIDSHRPCPLGHDDRLQGALLNAVLGESTVLRQQVIARGHD